MAEIWLATLGGAEGFEKPLVLKRILPEHARRRSFVELFIREAKVTAGLSHANIVQIYELGEVDNQYYIAMEYVKGWDLLRTLHQVSARKAKIPEAIALFLMARLCDALGYAHNATDLDGSPLHIIHHDVSPSNVLLSQDGALKLTDFGVARAVLRHGGGGSATRLRGKVAYMSPEQVEGREVDHRSDLFAAGILLYELFTIKRLFRGKSALETLSNVRAADIEPRLALHSELSDGVKAILRRALARHPKARYETAETMAEELRALLFDRRERVGDADITEWLRKLFSVKIARGAQGDPTRTRTFSWGQSRAAAGAPTGSRAPRKTSVSEATRSAIRRLSQARFVFRKEGGSTYGPVPFGGVLQLVRTHAVAPTEDVSINGGPWRPVQAIAALQKDLAAAFPPDAEQPTDAGRLDRFSAGRLLAGLAATLNTGRLRVIRQGVIRELWITRGQLAYATSTHKDDLLGPSLLARGVITRVELEVAYAASGTFGNAVGDALVRLGLLAPSAFFEHLTEHLGCQLIRLFTLEDATFGWFEGDPLPPGAPPMALPVFELLTRGVREHIGGADIEAYFERLGDPVLVPARERPFGLDLFRLSPREYRFARQLDAETPVSELLSRLGATEPDRADLLAVLFLMEQSGYLVCHREPPETQPPETQPPETQPPETQPPETQPPETQPPETQPPETQPPRTQRGRAPGKTSG